jgi:hypothetical protein
MSKLEVTKDGGKLILTRTTVAKTKKQYLARVEGAAEAGSKFPLDLHFMTDADLMEPVEFVKVDGENAAVEKYDVAPDTMFQTGTKGDRASFFTVNSKGQILQIERRDVHEGVGLEWETRSSGGY